MQMIMQPIYRKSPGIPLASWSASAAATAAPCCSPADRTAPSSAAPAGSKEMSVQWRPSHGAVPGVQLPGASDPLQGAALCQHPTLFTSCALGQRELKLKLPLLARPPATWGCRAHGPRCRRLHPLQMKTCPHIPANWKCAAAQLQILSAAHPHRLGGTQFVACVRQHVTADKRVCIVQLHKRRLVHSVWLGTQFKTPHPRRSDGSPHCLGCRTASRCARCRRGQTPVTAPPAAATDVTRGRWPTQTAARPCTQAGTALLAVQA